MASAAEYRQAFEPRIGADAVDSFLVFWHALVIGRLVAAPSWFILLVGIGLANIPLAVVGGALVVGNVYYLFKYGWGYRRKARYLAKEFLNLPDSVGYPPIDGNTQLFDGWVRYHARRDSKDLGTSEST